jgi:hypothetical protein
MKAALKIAALAPCASPGVWAHPHGEQWALGNEHRATPLSGAGDAYFAKRLGDRTLPERR